MNDLNTEIFGSSVPYINIHEDQLRFSNYRFISWRYHHIYDIPVSGGDTFATCLKRTADYLDYNEKFVILDCKLRVFVYVGDGDIGSARVFSLLNSGEEQ